MNLARKRSCGSSGTMAAMADLPPTLPSDSALSYLTPEARARVEIDEMLEKAGWAVQDAQRGQPGGVPRCRGARVRAEAAARTRRLPAVRRPRGGRCRRGEEGGRDAHRRRVAVGEVRRRPARRGRRRRSRASLPFVYESTGVETRFTNTLDPDPRSRQVFWFHRPETLWQLDRRDATRTSSGRRCATGCAGCPSSHDGWAVAGAGARDPQPRGVAGGRTGRAR